MNKENRFTVRLTDKEKDILELEAASRNISEAAYLRLLLTKTPMDYPEVRAQLRCLVKEVNFIGHNINQITKNYNAGYFHSADMANLISLMQKLRASVDRVVIVLGSQ